MDPAFSLQKLAKHLPKFYDIANTLCETIEVAQQSIPGSPIDVGKIMRPTTIGECS